MEIYSQKAARIYVRISLQMLSICKERHKSYTYTDCKQEWWQTSYVMEQLTVEAVNKAKNRMQLLLVVRSLQHALKLSYFYFIHELDIV